MLHRSGQHELHEQLHERAWHDRHRPHERALHESGRGQPLLGAGGDFAEPRGRGACRARDESGPGHRAPAEHEPHQPAAVRERAGDEPGVRAGLRHQIQGAQTVPAELHARQAAVLLHLPDHHGHPAVAQQDADAKRDLPVDHGPVPVLPAEPAAVAELHPTLALL